MLNKDLVTVLIPAFNHENFIEECIDSIINQTYQNIELIIINDGSSDKTSEKIKAKSTECKKRFKRFLFLENENQGIAKTLNQGCSHANGEYISLCASDDRYVSNGIEIMHRFLKNNSSYLLAVGENFLIDNKGQRCFFDKKGDLTYEKEKALFLSFTEFLDKNRQDVNFASDNFGKYTSLLNGNYIANGYLFRAKILLNEVKGFYEGEVLEDLFLHLQLSKYGKFKHINKHIFDYRIHDTNTSKNRKKMIKLTNNTLVIERKYDYEFKLKKRFKIPLFFEQKVCPKNEFLILTFKFFGLKLLKLKKKLIKNI